MPLGPGAGRALAVLGAFVLALATGIVPAAVVGLVAARLLVLLRVLTVDGARRAISWTTVVLVAGMIHMSTAMTRTGAADLIPDRLVARVGGAGPYALLAGLFLVTAVSGHLISNMATPVNLVVMSPAGCRFGDCWRLGILLLAMTFVVAVLLVPLVWPF